MQQQGTISPSVYDVWRKVDFIQQPVMTSSVVGPRRNCKALPKAELAPKDGSWSLFGGLLPVWSTTAFWIPVKPYIWEICSAHQWEALKTVTSAASTGQQKGPNPWQCPAAHNQYFKNWMNWATKFCLICYMHLISGQLTTTSSSNSTIFCRENASTTSRTHKIFSKSSLSLEAWIIFATEINKLISCWQKCVDCNGSCSD